MEEILRPDIFADRDADAVTVPEDRSRRFGRFKVAAFVKHIVGWEERFPDAVADFSLFQPSGGIAERFAWLRRRVVIDIADNEGNASGFTRKVVESLKAFRDELRFEYQVSRRVASERELGGDDEVSARFKAFAVGSQDAFGIAGEITDDGVDLSDTDIHRAAK